MSTHKTGPLPSSVVTQEYQQGWQEGQRERDELKRQLNAQRTVIDGLVGALDMVLPLAEAYLKSAPTHPDNAKLETARLALAEGKR